MRGWAGALRAALTVTGPGPAPGGFRERFDFGGRDVASWFPGHMAKGEGWERGGLTTPAPRRRRRCRSPSAVLQACGRCGPPCGAPTVSSRCTTLAYPPARLFIPIPPRRGCPPGQQEPGPRPLYCFPVSPSQPPIILPVPYPSPALHQPHKLQPPPCLGTCSHASTQLFSLAVLTSHCRAVTPCCRRYWASAHTSWC